MSWSVLVALALTLPLSAEPNFAVRVSDYVAGGLSSQLSTNREAALGSPSRETHDPLWGDWPVDPFSPPWQAGQVVTLRAGDSLTLEFEKPVTNHPDHPHGLDFLAFGNAFFVPNTGGMGGTNLGVTAVLVSADGQTFYRLDPGRAPGLDELFPTDGTGDFARPVNPRLRRTDFNGADLAGVRWRYEGSGGGAGYDLDWAQDAQGSNVVVEVVRFVRFEQLSGETQLDAVSGVSPVPAIREDFAAPPAERGWRTHGAASLFAWDAPAGHLKVTWDSSQANSYFFRPLGTVLSRDDDFLLSFDLRLDSVEVGVDPAKPYTFELAIGLLDLTNATRAGFHRGVYEGSPAGPLSLCEFDYFPDSGFGATISPTIVSRSNQFASGFSYPAELTTGEWFHVSMRFIAASNTLTTRVTGSDPVFPKVEEVVLPDRPFDFRLDTLAVCSYSDAGQDPGFGGSILASGGVDNLELQLSGAPVGELIAEWTETGTRWQFDPRPGWRYRLERTEDFQSWTAAGEWTATDFARVSLHDANAPAGRAFYRVAAEKP